MSRPTYILMAIQPTRRVPQKVNLRLGKSSSAGSLAAVGLGNMMQNCILESQLFGSFTFSPLKMDGWKMRPSFWDSLFSGATVKLGKGNCLDDSGIPHNKI